MNKTNEIIFCKENYSNNREKMFEAIAKQLALLMENEYVCKVYDDDRDIVVIQFEHDEKKDPWGCMELCWLEPEEVEVVEDYRLNNKEDDQE